MASLTEMMKLAEWKAQNKRQSNPMQHFAQGFRRRFAPTPKERLADAQLRSTLMKVKEQARQQKLQQRLRDIVWGKTTGKDKPKDSRGKLFNIVNNARDKNALTGASDITRSDIKVSPKGYTLKSSNEKRKERERRQERTFYSDARKAAYIPEGREKLEQKYKGTRFYEKIDNVLGEKEGKPTLKDIYDEAQQDARQRIGTDSAGKVLNPDLYLKFVSERFEQLADAYGHEEEEISEFQSSITPGTKDIGGEEKESKLPEGVTEEDIQYTMEKHNLSREEVLSRIGVR